MKIAIPLFALRRGRTSGLEYAIFNLMRGLVATGNTLSVAYSSPAYVDPAIRRWLNAENVPVARYPAFGAPMPGRFVEESVFSLLAAEPRVIFPNYHLPLLAPRIGHRSVFIYDLQHKVFPEYFGGRKVAWLNFQFRRSLAKADRIFFISQFELDQARRFFGDGFVDRASVVHVAIDWDRFDRGPVRDDLLPGGDRPFILSVAQQYPHKRLGLLIRAFGLLGRRQPDLALILVGRPNPELLEIARAELNEEVARRVSFTGFVSDAELGRLYREAAVFALPSVYEGFGMPAVEALSFGRPALLADATAVPEATMGFARYLPPSADAGEWAAALEEMVLDPPPVSEAEIGALRRRYDPAAVAQGVCRALNT